MFFIHIIFASYILLNIVDQIQTLVQIPDVEENDIAITETVIRNTVNNIFAVLKISGIKNRTRLKQFSTIHNFFVSITLKDCDNLKKIAMLSTVNNIDNSTWYFITNINEVLNEGNKKEPKKNNDNNFYVTVYIQKFIEKLKHLKETYSFYRNSVINSDVLKHLQTTTDKNDVINDDFDSDRANEKTSNEDILSENEFWKPSLRRIYQGIRTTIKMFPFMASIHSFTNFQCAGSIIKNDLVITSSSCLQIAWNNRFFRENPAFLSVKVGCDYYEHCGENIAVLEIYFHPQYDPRSLKHNLAIMRLSRTVNLRRSHGRVKKIDFDRNPSNLPVNRRITTVGWGATDNSNVIYSIFKNKLSYSELDFVPLDDCQEHYSKEFVTRKHFCAGFYTKGGGACSHDAGGPGIVDGILMGVISFGSPICGTPGIPTVFTKLGYYSDWIENVMEQTNQVKNIKTTLVPIRRPGLFHATTLTTNYTLYPIGYITTKSIRMYSHNKKKIFKKNSDHKYKDFITTVFQNEEVTRDLDRISIETKSKDKPRITKAVIRDGQEITYPEDLEEVRIIDSSGENISLNDNKDDILSITSDIETERESEKKSALSESDDDKALEKDIVDFIDNLDLDNILSQKSVEHLYQNSTLDSSIEKSQKYTEFETSLVKNKAGETMEINTNPESILKSIFFSDDSSDTSDEKKAFKI